MAAACVRQEPLLGLMAPLRSGRFRRSERGLAVQPSKGIMGLDYVALAIPFYFLLIGVELWAARRRKQRVYRLADTLTNIGCGIMQQVGMLFLGATLLTGYTFIFEHARLIHFRAGSPVPWLMAFVAVDFLYYWWHRLSHTVNALWAVHMVHHQSEDYNLSVALRQAVFDGLTMWPFFLTMAFLGVPPMAMATAVALSSLFQFWLHTELVRRLGFLELFLNTPSHHRVHHAINPRYLDKNFGAVLIVWDRLFGTFEEEREPTVYGITHPMRSFNPLWVQVAPWVKLAREARRTPRWRDKLHVWFASPEWHPPGVEVQSQPLAPPGSERKYDVEVSARMRWYLAAHFGLQVVATFALMLWGKALSLPVLVAAASVLLLSLVTGAGLLEHRRWAPALELARWGLLGVLGWVALRV